MTRRRKRHSPEQIVVKLRDADAMLNAGQAAGRDASVLQFDPTIDTGFIRCRRRQPAKSPIAGLRATY